MKDCCIFGSFFSTHFSLPPSYTSLVLIIIKHQQWALRILFFLLSSMIHHFSELDSCLRHSETYLNLHRQQESSYGKSNIISIPLNPRLLTGKQLRKEEPGVNTCLFCYEIFDENEHQTVKWPCNCPTRVARSYVNWERDIKCYYYRVSDPSWVSHYLD